MFRRSEVPVDDRSRDGSPSPEEVFLVSSLVRYGVEEAAQGDSVVRSQPGQDQHVSWDVI